MIEAVLELAGLPYRMRLLDSAPSTPLPNSFVAVNPWRQVPVLDGPDGTRMTELAAILLWLERQHPSVGNGPTLHIQDLAAFHRWSVFLAVNIYEGTLRRSYPARYLSEPCASNAETLNSVRDAAFARNHAAFLVLEQHLAAQNDPSHGLCGEGLSPCDIFAAMLYAWHNERPDLPRCADLTHRVANHPQIAPLWQRNFDHRLARKWVDRPSMVPTQPA